MKIIKTKTYKGMVDQIDRLTKQVLKQQGELHKLQNDIQDLQDDKQTLTKMYNQENDNHNEALNRNAKLATDIDGYKKEIKRLKTLCTKNNISYMEDKECKKK